ncbi:MAG TPA: flagellin [Bryobacteraceae bacterium]|nr:flagellin [Bryobacteraceae bacterium]
MISLQTNVNSLVAQQNLSVNNAFQSKTIDQLTSGYRINSSGDDAAGLAVANKFRNSIAELSQGVSNGNDATAQLQIMDGGLSNIGQMLDRLKTLAMQSSSATFSGGDTGRAQLNSEFQSDLAEIDRQAQSIGLNTGGTFAKNLSVYLGAGSGSQGASNAVVNVDLSQSTVDALSLGLKGVQAVNSNAYDLSGSSKTSVHAILNDTGNGATASSAPVASTTFTFFGAGFSNADGTTTNGGVTINVNLNGVGDTTSLVNAINAAIQVQAQQPTGQASAFKTAGIQASVITDANGNQKLAFTSASSSFEVQADDQTSNALMGNFAADGTSAATGAQLGTSITGKSAYNLTDNVGAGSSGGNLDFSAAGQSVTLTFNGAGLSGTKTVVLNANYQNTTNFANAAAIIADINTKLAAAGVANIAANTTDVAGKITFKSTAGSFTVSASGTNSGGIADLGMNATAGSSGVGNDGTYASAGAAYSTSVANGGYEMASSSSGSAAVSNFKWGGAVTATQAVSITAADSTGASHPITVTLDNTSGLTVASAVGAINSALQKSDDSTLQQITAVAVNDNGVTKINFVSTLSNFSVALGTSTGTKGITDASGAQGSTTQALQIGSGGTADISTLAGAQAAVTAITNAVSALGSAQASIGKGENQLGYAISLAQSQITNYSAAESQIRDANVAQEAADLSKAQVLSQASIAAMAQANSAPQGVLALLRG